MRFLELRIPPVVFSLLTAALMAGVAWAARGLNLAIPGSRLLAGGLFAAGASISVLGVVTFRRARTTMNPLQPTRATTLVVSGIYRISRNPMYLGFLVCLLGWAILLSNPAALLPIPLFVLGMNRWQIVPEETALTQRFGTAFVAYMARTRRWL